MPMPKGHKSENGYATVTNQGLGYREIAENMTKNGFKMNHATARNYFIRAMTKLAETVSEHSDRDPTQLAADPRFQMAIAEILKEES
jgi:hypothetical protein